MKPKSILMLSVLAGLLAVVLVQAQLSNERGGSITLFKATESLPVGQTLGSRVETVTLPGEKLFPNLLKEAPTLELQDYVATTPLREPVAAGQVILFRHFEATSDRGLRAEIPRDKRAFSIEVDAASAVSFLIQPEDRVDVLGALPDSAAGLAEQAAAGTSSPRPQGLNQGFEQALRSGSGFEAQILDQVLAGLPGTGPATELRTEILLEDVQVLAVGRRYRRSQPQAWGADYDTVTLLVSQEQAKTLAYARDVHNSPLTLVLRGVVLRGEVLRAAQTEAEP